MRRERVDSKYNQVGGLFLAHKANFNHTQCTAHCIWETQQPPPQAALSYCSDLGSDRIRPAYELQALCHPTATRLQLGAYVMSCHVMS